VPKDNDLGRGDDRFMRDAPGKEQPAWKNRKGVQPKPGPEQRKVQPKKPEGGK